MAEEAVPLFRAGADCYDAGRMNGRPMKTRFAPSPTGALHLGNVRTALFNALLARHHGGIFLLRIEDTDRERCRPEYVDGLLEDLRWLGLDWQEGPARDGGAGPYHQAERAEIYDARFRHLLEADLAYPCYCSEQELAVARKVQMAAGQPPRYPGTCAALTPEQRAEREVRGLKPTLRFRVPAGREILFEDLVRGPQRFRSEDIGDFIIRRADGSAAFLFANAVDDALMGVTHVLRGEDHLANTPRQLLLFEALELAPPQYGHISLIVGEDGAPLSKRHGSTGVRELREAGYLPGALLNHLARLGHAYEDAQSYMDFDGLAAGFHAARLGRAPARHDPRQLEHWQKEAVAHSSDQVLWDWLSACTCPDGSAIADWVPADRVMAFVHAIRDNILLPPDACLWAGDLFSEPDVWDPDARGVIREAGSGFYAQALACLEEAADDFRDYAKALSKAVGVKGRALFLPLRAALTGVLRDPERGGIWREGPELGRLWPLLGRQRIEARLRAALALCD